MTRLTPYYGGKGKMIKPLWVLIPKCKKWYEPFAGVCTVTLNSERHMVELVNEKNPNIWTLLRVMQDEKLFKQYIKVIWRLKYSREIFLDAKKMIKREGLDAVKVAVCQFILLSQSYNNLGQYFSKKDVKNYQETNVSNAYRIHERLQGVEIRNLDALQLLLGIIWEEDAFIFLDPPYLHDYRGKGADKAYGHCEMTYEEHREMLTIVRDAKCKIMICGYRDKDGSAELYDGILGKSKTSEWHCYLLADIPKPNRGGERAKEYIWVNYKLPPCADGHIIMEDVMRKNK